MANLPSSALPDSRVTRAAALARTLESEIVTAGLSPGERLGTKDDLRQRFGVAVATINEAVRLMEMRGMVVARPGPGGGVFVTPPSARASVSQLILGFNWGKATLADCVEVRNALEPLICRHAARDHRDGDIRALAKILDKMEGSTGDPHSYFEVNWEFHRRLATICTNAPLQSIYLVLCDFLQSGLGDLEFDVIEPERVAAHRRLLAAIDAGEGQELESALLEHAALSPLTSSRAP
jgi:GntR family transcriptional regulator, transcriptional repressor for pyruvate dehydrogenase complex